MASRFSYAAAVFFVVGMALVIAAAPPPSYVGTPPPVIIVATLAFLAFHLSLLPVVAALDAPEWAKASGYAWIAIDNMLNVMTYFGVDGELITPMRMGVHFAAASWIGGASMSAAGTRRVVGLLAALALVGASLVGPFVPAAARGSLLGPAGLLLVVWLILVGRGLRTTIAACVPR